jgi:Domain of unknown function (DUF4440)
MKMRTPSCAVMLKGFLAIAISLAILPARTDASTGDDEKAVAALDTEYQAAVEKNDATKMDRILADDFVLVTGRGVSYVKADLLKEARSKKVTYEHQEDSQQRVRVWGGYRGCDRSPVGEGDGGRQIVRLQAMVQRHLRPHTWRLALRIRPGIAAITQGTTQMTIGPGRWAR